MKNVLSNGRCARWRDDETFILLPGNKSCYCNHTYDKDRQREKQLTLGSVEHSVKERSLRKAEEVCTAKCRLVGKKDIWK